MLVELKGGAPVVVLYGEPNVGKTIIANALMSVAGIEACRMRREFFCSPSFLGLPKQIQEVETSLSTSIME